MLEKTPTKVTDVNTTSSYYDRSHLHSEEIWQNIIEKVWKLNVSAEGISNASKIMIKVSEGLEFIYLEALKRNAVPPDFKYPAINAVDSYKQSVFIAYDPSFNSFIVNLETLALYSTIPQDIDISATDNDGEIRFIGFLVDYCYLGGVEEMTHAIESQRDEISTTVLPSDSSTELDYDSQDHEFRAIKWQLFAARRVHMPLQTIRALRSRFNRVKKYRNSSSL